MNSILRGDIFKKQTELPPEPELLSSSQICEDLSVADEDSLYTNGVKDIIATHDLLDMNPKAESFNPKSFDTIDRILKAKEDIIVQRTSLTEQIDKLRVIGFDLKVMRESVQNEMEKV